MAESSLLAGLRLLEDEDFVLGRVWPLASSGKGLSRPSSYEVTSHRRREDGRAVAEYAFGDSRRVFAKLYPSTAAGGDAHTIYDGLYRRGFGAGSPHRVPEPIAYLGDIGVLVLRAAPGERLAGTETRDPAAFEDGVARAAGWLAALHASPLGLCPRESIGEATSRLARRAAKATACRPELAGSIRAALAELETRRPPAPESAPRVQTHGRFHAGHVYVAPECVTAVDLDRAAEADPAKDLGEFLHGLRSIGARTGVVDDAVGAASARFLDEYARHRPGALSGLAYRWSYCVLWTLLGLTFKDRPARPGWKERMEFFRNEFDEVPARAGALLSQQRQVTAGWPFVQ